MLAVWKRPIRLRDEPAPDGAVLVVRAGLLASSTVEDTCKKNYREFGFYGVSVFAALDLPVDELCRAEDALSRYSRIRVASCAAVRRNGFPILPTHRRPHFDVVLSDLQGDTIDRLTSCFGDDQLNPARA